ncbi:MAG: outer membrane beta-barrel protein [Armatimonadetes bacterium]|nr:outer membrane beta-barrel protein [Armatimonadota bacterium]
MKAFFIRGIASVVVAVVVATAATLAQSVELGEQPPPAPLPEESTTPLRPAFAKKGSVELGGSVGYSSSSQVENGSTDDAISTFLIAPHVGYFISDGVEIGLNPLSISVISTESVSLTTVHSLMSFSYNGTTANGVHPFIEGLFGFAIQQASYQSSFGGSSSDSRNGLSFGGRGGVKYEIASGALLNASLQYLQVTLNGDNDRERNGYNTLAFELGFSVNL